MKYALALCAALSACTLAVAASDPDRAAKFIEQTKAKFDQADTNHDGQVSRDEAKAGMPQVYKHFDEIDTAHKGYVTLDDLKTYGMAKRAARQQAKQPSA